MHKVFIDGSAGTTGLKIFDRLSLRKDLQIITLPEQFRKDINARKDALNSCDVAFLCLPDLAAKEAVSLIENEKVKVIDTSTAHRTSTQWVYGFAELNKEQRAKIAASKFPQVNVLCGDVETTAFDRKFDCIMVYNAFPHFPDPVHLVEVLAGLLEPGGRLSVAHGMSRAALCDHHAGRAANVSIDLLHEQELAAIFSDWFDVDVVISDDHMYQISGVRKEGTVHSHGGQCRNVLGRFRNLSGKNREYTAVFELWRFRFRKVFRIRS